MVGTIEASAVDPMPNCLDENAALYHYPTFHERRSLVLRRMYKRIRHSGPLRGPYSFDGRRQACYFPYISGSALRMGMGMMIGCGAGWFACLVLYKPTAQSLISAKSHDRSPLARSSLVYAIVWVTNVLCQTPSHHFKIYVVSSHPRGLMHYLVLQLSFAARDVSLKMMSG